MTTEQDVTIQPMRCGHVFLWGGMCWLPEAADIHQAFPESGTHKFKPVAAPTASDAEVSK